jgi:hypothetical protein
MHHGLWILESLPETIWQSIAKSLRSLKHIATEVLPIDALLQQTVPGRTMPFDGHLQSLLQES